MKGALRIIIFIITGIFMVAALTTVALFYGPRPRLDPVSHLPELPKNWRGIQELDRKANPGLRPGTEKMIWWFDPQNPGPQPYAILFFHGFGGSRDEVDPVFKRVAREIGANILYTRLTGHGLDGPAMATADVNDWARDALEAWVISQELGEKTILAGMSTGGTLATWLARQNQLQIDPHALILISPNFGPRDPRAELVTLAGGRVWVPWVGGKELSWEATEPEMQRIWTNPYPTVATIPMMTLVKKVRTFPFEQMKVPAFFIYSWEDRVVDPAHTDRVFEEWAPEFRTRWNFNAEESGNNHNILGGLRAPSYNDEGVKRIAAFIQSLPLK